MSKPCQVWAPPPFLRRLVMRKARFLPGGSAEKLDDRPGDTDTDGTCTRAGKVRASPIDIKSTSFGSCTRAGKVRATPKRGAAPEPVRFGRGGNQRHQSREGSGPPDLRRFVLRKARLLLGEVGRKLDDRPGDIFYRKGWHQSREGSGKPTLQSNPPFEDRE